MSQANSQLIGRLESQLSDLTLVLYDTGISPDQAVAKVSPFLDEQVRFVDPWQSEIGIEKYRMGLAGFHSMFKFRFEIFQLDVSLDDAGRTGRCLVDGVMHLRQLEPLYTYPLRTILTYRFDIDDPGSEGRPVRFRIREHEEMWSYADMIAEVPLLGWAYSKLFRPAFARGFLIASRWSSRARGFEGR